jgi:hypothetical protein
MRLTFCVAARRRMTCSSITLSETNLITLCCDCHAKLHQRQVNGVCNHRERTRAGLTWARELAATAPCRPAGGGGGASAQPCGGCHPG